MNDETIVRVAEVMHRGVDVIDGRATIAEALHAMQYPDNKLMLVRKRDVNDEFGALLLSDIARHVIAPNRAPERVNVYEIMAKPVISVPSRMDIRYCARLLDRFNLSRAPVIDGDEPVGVVSFTGIVLRGLRDRMP
ncbi:MAG: CBS domain-containing protein [Chromatiales bacterium]|nr:CBS domain-containing protein [Chromatiales bacterium]